MPEPSVMRNEDPHAMVLSGGGAFGAYGLGVMKALFTGQSKSSEHKPINPSIFTGTSIGAVNAALLASEADLDAAVALRAVERFWWEKLAGSKQSGCGKLFRLRGDPASVIDPDCLLKRPVDTLAQYGGDAVFFASDLAKRFAAFVTSDLPVLQRSVYLASVSAFVDPSAFIELIHQSVNSKQVSNSPRLIKIVATNWRTGNVQFFGNKEFADREAYKYVAASAAVPGIFPPVEIHGEPYVDGGVLMNTPLKPAIKLGARTLHVIDMSPEVRDMPTVASELYALQSTLAIVERLIVMAGAKLIEADVNDAAEINRGLKALRELSKGAELNRELAQDLIKLAGKVKGGLSELADFHAVTIHRYQPSKPLGGALSILDLDPKHIEGWIELGFEDSARHDCVAARCVFPE